MPAFIDMLLSGQAAWFGVPALLATLLFVIRIILLLAGAHHGADFHHDVPDSGPADHHADSRTSAANDAVGAFKVLSLQTIIAFAMGFGWAGIAALNGFHKSFVVCVLFGIIGGVAMVWLLALLLKAMSDLQTSGNISLESTVGLCGDVYVTVPPKGQGTGQVRVVVSDRMRIYNAHSADAAAPTASKVRVLAVNEDNTLTVVPI
jgi:hypothetical protein